MPRRAAGHRTRYEAMPDAIDLALFEQGNVSLERAGSVNDVAEVGVRVGADVDALEWLLPGHALQHMSGDGGQ